MYQFVDTMERPQMVSPSIQTIFNQTNIDDVLTDNQGSFITLTVSGRSNAKQRIKTFEVASLDGLAELGFTNNEPIEIIVKFKISDRTNEGFRNRLTKLKDLLSGTKKKLIFTDEDVYFYATFSELDIPEEDSNNLVGAITFFCSDPYKYSLTEQEHTLQDSTLIENEGSESTPPTIELTANKSATYAMVENGLNEYNLAGFPLEEEGQEQVVDDRVSVLYENGSTLDTWSTTNNKVDTNFIDISGIMGYDGSGIRAEKYGTGDRIHGPAVTKELPTAIQDFEIVTNFDIISKRPDDNFRIEVYFTDENLNMLGKIGIKDNSRTFKRRHGLGRVGHYRGKGASNGYAIGSQNYKLDDVTDVTLMNLKVKREGNLYKFYIARWRNQRHTWVLEEKYRDVDNQFNGKLKFITLFVGNYKDRRLPTRLRINDVEVFELKKLNVDQTPYLLHAGDKIIFDHKNEEILINGQDAMPLKHFGGEFWQLLKGYNNITISPPDTFTGKIKYRERYK